MIASGVLWQWASCCLERVVASDRLWPWASQVWCAMQPKALNGWLDWWRKHIADCQSGAPVDREGWELPTKALTTSRSVGAIKGPPSHLGVVPPPPQKANFEHTTTSNLYNHTVDLLERDFERVLELWLCHFDLCALSFACVRVVAVLCSCVCLYSPPYSSFDYNHLCKAWKTPICGDSSQQDIDIRNTIVSLKFDLWITWVGLSATLDQRRSPQRGVGIGRTTVKKHCVSCLFYLLWLLSSRVLYSLVILLLSLILILKEQSSEEFSWFLSSHPNLVLVFTNTYYKPTLCCLELILQYHLFTPALGALNDPPRPFGQDKGKDVVTPGLKGKLERVSNVC
jgi:hypothetical protein